MIEPCGEGQPQMNMVERAETMLELLDRLAEVARERLLLARMCKVFRRSDATGDAKDLLSL